MPSFPLTMQLETRRLRLRSAADSDLDLIWSASRIAGFNDGMSWDPPENKAEIAEEIERSRRSWMVGRDFIFTLADKSSQIALGRVGVMREQGDCWNLGYWVHPEYWHCGFASEAAQAAVDFAFQHLRADSLVASHALWNESSGRILHKLGFHVQGKNPCGFVKHGEPVPELEYRLTKRQYFARFENK